MVILHSRGEKREYPFKKIYASSFDTTIKKIVLRPESNNIISFKKDKNLLVAEIRSPSSLYIIKGEPSPFLDFYLFGVRENIFSPVEVIQKSLSVVVALKNFAPEFKPTSDFWVSGDVFYSNKKIENAQEVHCLFKEESALLLNNKILSLPLSGRVKEFLLC